MVKLYPVRSLKSTVSDAYPVASMSSPSNKTPNRFRSKIYDRSVFGGDDCVKASGPCRCYQCTPYPLVVVSTGESVCNQYNLTSRNVKEFLDGGLLESIEEETFMIYAQKNSSGGVQIGILAALDVDDCRNKVVKRHELCIPETEAPVPQKVKLYQSLYVDPIMIMYRQNEIIDTIVNRIISSESPVEMEELASNGCQHYLWTVKDKEDIQSIQQAFEVIDSLYIADGHHRTAAACKVQSSPRPGARKTNLPPVSSRFITALIFPDTQLNVLSFNRCIKSLEGYTETTFLEAVAENFHITKLSDVEIPVESKDSSHNINMYIGKSWYNLVQREDDAEEESHASWEIDAQILVDKLFKPILNMSYPEGEKNMIYIDGRSGKDAVQACVDSGEAAVGFTVARVSTRMIMKIADADKVLPPKATFFDPKPIPGLMLRLKR